MADVLPTDTLDAVKTYLNITWQDAATDAKITGYIQRGMTRLQKIAGVSLDFTAEDQPRMLLLDYCRYANAQALEMFEQNFAAELLDLNLSAQAPATPSLSLTISAGSTPAGVAILVAPQLNDGDSYLYTVGPNLAAPAHMAQCAPGAVYTAWDGASDIPAADGQQVLIVEIDFESRAVAAGVATV